MSHKNYTIELFNKGRAFLASAGLLNAYDLDRAVYLHLLCQAFENIGKALLLKKDYDFYFNRIPKKNFLGHNLIYLFDELQKVTNIKFTDTFEEEVRYLNTFYLDNDLRYYSTKTTLTLDELKLERLAIHKELVNLIHFMDAKV